MKYFLTLIIIFFPSLFISVISQDKALQKIDSLQNAIATLPKDSVRVNWLLFLSNELFNSGEKSEALEAANQAVTLSKSLSSPDKLALSLLKRCEIHLALLDYISALNNANEALDIYRKTDNNTGTTKALYWMGQIYSSQSAHAEAIRSYHQALDEAKKVGNDSIMATIQLYLANQYNYKGQPDQARMFAEQAKALFEIINYSKGLAMTYNAIGESHRMQSQYTKAIENYYHGLKITEDHELKKNEAILLNNLGLILIEQKKFKEATQIYLKLIEINQKAGNLAGIALNYNNIGLCHSGIGQYQQAIEDYNKGLEANKSIADKRIELILLYNIGESYMFLNKNDIALPYFRDSYQISKATGNEEAMTYGLNGLGLVHIHLHKFDKAAEHLEGARNLALKKGFREPLMENYQHMVKLDSMQGNYLGTFEWYKRYETLKDSLNNELKSKQITEVQAQYQSEKKDKEILQLNQAKELAAVRHTNERTMFGVIVLFLTLLAAVLLYMIIKRRQVNKLLSYQKREIEEKNEELSQVNEEINSMLETVEEQNKMLNHKNIKLEELSEEKDGLIGVVAHDLRSPISKAQGLADLVKNAGELNERQLEFIDLIKSVCKDGNRLIQDLLLINMAENKSSTPQYQEIKMDKYIAELSRNYETLATKKQITLHIANDLPEDFYLESDRDYLTRILDNLLSNAIKFSLPYHSVYLSVKQEQQQVVIEVKDEGPGMTNEDKKNLFKKFKRLSAKPTGGESSTGLGLSIVKTLVDKLNGQITVESKEQKGSAFEIILPNNQHDHK